MLHLESNSPSGLRRAAIAVAALVALSSLAKAVQAQPDGAGYPSTAIRFVVPYAPGGPALPVVATLAQSGVAGYEFNTGHGIFAPAATLGYSGMGGTNGFPR